MSPPRWFFGGAAAAALSLSSYQWVTKPKLHHTSRTESRPKPTVVEKGSSSDTIDVPASSPLVDSSSSRPMASFAQPCTSWLNHYPSMLLPSYDNLVIRRSYLSSVNNMWRIPNWVAERLTQETVNGPADRANSKFEVDPAVPLLVAARNEDYFRSGYSRGHMASAGAHKDSQEAMNDTFLLSGNIAPQELSSNGCDWYRLEVFSRNLTRTFRDVYCLNGPLFLPNETQGKKSFVRYEVIGGRLVAVPTHFFKIIVAVDPFPAFPPTTVDVSGNKSQQLVEANNLSTVVAAFRDNIAAPHTQGGKSQLDNSTKAQLPPGAALVSAFVVPNAPIAEEQPLTAFQVPLSFVSFASGLDLSGIFEPLAASATIKQQAPAHGTANSIAVSEGTALQRLALLPSEPNTVTQQAVSIPRGPDNFLKERDLDLCSKVPCEVAHSSRVDAWRYFGRIKLVDNLDSLEAVWAEASEKGLTAENSFLEREYKYKKFIFGKQK